MMGRFGSEHLGNHGRFGDTGDFGKTTIQRAVTPWRTSVLKRTLALGLVGQHHFAHASMSVRPVVTARWMVVLPTCPASPKPR